MLVLILISGFHLGKEMGWSREKIIITEHLPQARNYSSGFTSHLHLIFIVLFKIDTISPISGKGRLREVI